MMMKKNEIPSSIAVGGVLYGVESFGDKREYEDFTGEVDFANAMIRVEKNLPPQIAAQTLLSSVVGCILAHSGMSLVLGDKEDCVVECLAYGMLDVLRCNPSLMEYISRLDE
jgi:hypothetical protein